VVEHKRNQGLQSDSSSFRTSKDNSYVSDVSSETHHFSSSDSSESLTSSDSEPDLIDQPIRVYDARFKIPAQSNIG